MKEFLSSLEAKGYLHRIKEEFSPELEIGSLMHSAQETPLLFESVKGSSLAVVGNLYGRRDYLELGLKLEPGSLVDSIEEAVRFPSSSKGRVSDLNKDEWSYFGEADLSRLPILKYFPREAGSYITAGIVATRFPGSELENLSFHRMLVLSKNKLAVRVVPRHLYQIDKELRKKFPVSIIIGPPPSVFLSASLQVEYGSSEYKIANKLESGSLELVKSETSEIVIPNDSEIVLEGYIDFQELVDEGPFVDLTGTYDEVRRQPVLTVLRMRYKKESVYQAVVASTKEHSLFMGLPQELKIREALAKSIPSTRGINLTPSGGGYFHCVVSLNKGNDGDGKTAIMNCFAASHPLKLVIAVDGDIDPFDLEQVEWALATRFQASSGLVVINGAKGSSLDPSSGKSAVTSKMGLDATLPIKAARTTFEKAKVVSSSKIDSIKKTLSN